jgi:hypothetical protein
MPVLLQCDAPGCAEHIAGAWRRGVLSPPKPWWLQTTSDGRTVCACSTEHLNAAIQAAPKVSTPEAEA